MTDQHDWLEVTDAPLPVADVVTWVVQPSCGAVAVFCGTVRDRSCGRPGVVGLEYEAYPGPVESRLASLADVARSRWPEIGRVALLHRVGSLEVGEVSVVVAVSTPSRGEAFAAAKWCIDTLKTTVPIWKRETWAGGSDWGLCAHEVEEIEDSTTP